MSKVNKFSVTNELGDEIGSVILEKLWGNVYGLFFKKTQDTFPIYNWVNPIKLACKKAKDVQADSIWFRLVESPHSKEFSPFLKEIGFVKKQDRVEYKKNIDQLPSDEGTPLAWKSALELRKTPEQIASVVATVAEGDPGHDPNEDPLKFIEDFLSDSVLKAGLQCIHFGFLKDELAAITVVQINPKTGWSRISYMGILPKFRGQGLGKWVHRFSFSQMKREGGKLYHGGTVANNVPMIQLFETHNCELFCKMEEWIYTVKAVSL